MKIPKFFNSKIKIATGIVVGLLIGFIIVPLIYSRDNIYTQIKKYQDVFGYFVKEYFEEVNMDKMTEDAIRGMIKELDPHSAYISAKDMRSVNEDMAGSFEGIGIEFRVIDDTLVVNVPIRGGPCDLIGVMPGDKIVEVNGNSIVGIPQDSIPKLLKGPKGTVVKLGIARSGNKGLLQFVVTRDRISKPSVDAYLILEGTDIGLVKVNRFAQTTHREMVEATRKLKSQGMKKLILDLRGNGGGILEQAFLIADEFLKGGDTIVYTKGRKPDSDQIFVANSGQELENIPLIILIDGGSASASEIVSGSVQDLDRGLIVGLTSFGKGLVQRQFPIFDGSAIRVTTSRYYTPSGRCIQRPFKDREDWKKLTDRLELEEGANIEHTLDKIKKEETLAKKDKDKDKKVKKKKGDSADKFINLDSIEIFYTKSGRPVLGGGGVTPDFVIKYDDRKLSEFTVSLWGKGIFMEFANNNWQNIKEKYSNDFSKFNSGFSLDKKMIKDLQKFAENKEIEWKEEDFESSLEDITMRIKLQLARIIWDNNAEAQVLIDIDRQLKKAMELFPLAEKIQTSSRVENMNKKK